MDLDFFAVFIHWLHLISAIIWIGGNAFQVLVFIPFVKEGNPSYELMLNVSRRFNRLSLIFMLFLVVTGGMNLGFRRMGAEAFPAGYMRSLAFKLIFVVIMASVLLYGLVRAPGEDKKSLELPSFNFAKLSLLMGLIIVFFAAMLRKWPF